MAAGGHWAFLGHRLWATVLVSYLRSTPHPPGVRSLRKEKRGDFFFFFWGKKDSSSTPWGRPPPTQHGRSLQSPIPPAGSGGRAEGLWVSGLAVPKPWGALGRAVPFPPFPLPRLGLWPAGAGRLGFVLCKRMLMAGPAMRWLSGIKMPAVLLLPPLFLLLLPPPSPGSKMAAAGKCGVDRNERQRKQRWQEAAAARGALCCAGKDRSQRPPGQNWEAIGAGEGAPCSDPAHGSELRLGASRTAFSERRDRT